MQADIFNQLHNHWKHESSGNRTKKDQITRLKNIYPFSVFLSHRLGYVCPVLLILIRMILSLAEYINTYYERNVAIRVRLSANDKLYTGQISSRVSHQLTLRLGRPVMSLTFKVFDDEFSGGACLRARQAR